MASKKEQQSPNKRKFTSPLGNQKYVKGIFPKFKANLKDFNKSAKHGKQKSHFDLVQKRKLQERQKGSPIRYQLGGDCTDPLNLNSLIDRDPSFVTPQASPSPHPTHEESPIPILEPRDTTDPLNLKCIPSEDGKEGAVVTPAKKKKKKRKRHCSGHDVENDAESPEKIEEDSSIPNGEKKKKRRKRLKRDSYKEQQEIESAEKNNSCEAREDKLKKSQGKQEQACETAEIPRKKTQSVVGESDNVPSLADVDKEENKMFQANSNAGRKLSETVVRNDKKVYEKSKKKGKLFIYGNYNRYYGYRNNQGTEDSRIKIFKSEWFEGKDVLDIGCNVGHLTLTIARDFAPHLIMGVDIDTGLIRAAQNNLRNYTRMPVSRTSSQGTEFPVSFALTKGPLAAPVLHQGVSEEQTIFPNNVLFKQENYVPTDGRVMERQQPMYDTILCLSLTKWIHLNWGDSGVKLMFQKIFRHLRPGGRLILEPQPFASYKKKKNLTEKIRANYDAIKLRPEHFIDYLLSQDVGFVSYEALEMPSHKAAGFCRPLYLFTKQQSAHKDEYFTTQK